MTINVSVISHAFFTEAGACRAIPRCLCGGVLSNNPSDQPADMKIDNIACECMQSQDTPYLRAASHLRTAGSCACKESLMSPRSAMAASPSPRTIVEASSSPRLTASANPSPRGGGKCQGRKKGNKKRGGRRRGGADGGGESKEPRIIQSAPSSTENRSGEGAETSTCIHCGNKGLGNSAMLAGFCEIRAIGDVSGGEEAHTMEYMGGGSGNVSAEPHLMEVDLMVRKVREECSSALGIVKEDLELFGLCHIPSSAERVTLLKDKSGIVHLGVMVHNSDLNLQSIEELVVRKDKAEQEAENYCHQVSEKSQDFDNLKLKYEKLTEEVLRLRTMVNRANHLRRESEKATEVLRVEFEKLVKTLFMECSSHSLDKAELVNE